MAREASSVQKPTCAGRFRSVGVLTAALLILTACGSGQPADTASQTGSSTTRADASSTTPVVGSATGSPRVFTDQELMSISSKVLEPHGGRAGDTAIARKSYALMTQPPASGSSPVGPTEPAECNVFHRSWQHEAQLDLSMGFALGDVSNLGDHGVGMILFDVRSAPRDTLAKADFDYSQELMARCATFDQTVTGATGPQKFAIQLLPGPDIGEKAYATRQSFNGNITGVGLRVLAGTVSLDMGSNTGMAISEDEALSVMTQIAKEFIDAARNQ